jgi:hypothetical protein
MTLLTRDGAIYAQKIISTLVFKKMPFLSENWKKSPKIVIMVTFTSEKKKSILQKQFEEFRAAEDHS